MRCCGQVKMAQIRGTIELLTKILKENGASKLRAEIFRLGKFNQDEAVSPLWRLLFELIYYCDYGKIDDVSIRALGTFSTEEVVIFVKREVQKRGFYSRDFANLPTDMSSGSRELLLALGWLLCKENILYRFMINCTSPLDDDTSVELLGSGDGPRPIKKLELSSLSQDPAERVHQLLWLNNKLRLNLRNLLALQKEKNMLKHKIHEATQGVSLSGERNHLSMLEVYMLRHPELLKKNLQLLEKDNERLQNLLLWKDHEDIFWKWMESVLDAKLQDTGDGVHIRNQAAAMSNGLDPEHISRVQEAHHNLQSAIMKYEQIVENLEKNWQEKSADLSDEEIDSVLASLDLELAVQKANIAVCTCDEYLQQDTKPQFVLQKKQPNKRAPVDSASDDLVPLHTMTDIQHEIDELNSMVDRLQGEVDIKQNNFKAEMQKLSDKFRGALCIPPAAVKV